MVVAPSQSPSPPISPITVHHSALNQMIPSALTGKSGSALILELTKNNLRLANAIINLYYRIERNVNYISEGKSSLHSVLPYYATSGTNLLNSGASRNYFYLIHKHAGSSFGHTIRLASHLIQNNKMRWIQNSKGLSGPRVIK
jgi:hypothetical protein